MRTGFAVLCTVLFGGIAGFSNAATRVVPYQYPTIQSAVDAAAPGDVIQVFPQPGIDPAYHENVVVPATAVNLTLIGDCAVLDGTGAPGSGITLLASGAHISGFVFRNYKRRNSFDPLAPGLLVNESALSGNTICVIRNNVFAGNEVGLKVSGRRNPTVVESHRIHCNTMRDNTIGLLVANSNGPSEITMNRITGNGQEGALFFNADGSNFHDNDVSRNGATAFPSLGAEACGVEIQTCCQGDPFASSRFAGNAIHDNSGAGFFVSAAIPQTITDNTLERNQFGIYLTGCLQTTVQANRIRSASADGIVLLNFTQSCLVRYNDVRGCAADGIHVVEDPTLTFPDTTGNTFRGNTALGNLRFDAEDESGTSAATVKNVWGENVFGKSNPPGLG